MKLFSKPHEWVEVDGDTVSAGITDFAQKELSDIVYVELPSPGKKVEMEKEFMVIESVKVASDIYSPVSGEITAVNKTLQDTPEIVNKDAEGAGWLVKIKLSRKEELSHLMSKEQYSEYTKTKK